MSGYENYTLSPVPWIKQMPGHWGLVRGKNLYQKMQRPTSETDEVVTCFRDGTVTLRKKRRTTGFTESLKEIGYQGIRKGDLVIHVMDAFAGSIGVSDSDGKGTPVYSVCQAKGDSNNQYYALLLREMARSGYIQSLYRGIRERSSDFRFEVFAAQFYPVPPLDEQDQIVRFLDWKVSNINKLINIKKTMIARLEERKKAIINGVLTDGAIDSVCKKSTIEGLSTIPTTWDERPLKFYASSNDESLSSKTPSNYEFNYIDISTTGFRKLKKEPVRITFEEAPSRAKRIVREGDTILSTVRTYLKAILYIDNTNDGNVVSTGFAVLRPKDGVYPPLLSYALSCDYFINAVIRNSVGVSYPAINDKRLLSLKLALPKSYDEQVKLYEQITALTESTDIAIKYLQDMVNGLKDLRTCLISDAVTGKIDVRGIEIPEYEFVDEDIDNADENLEQGAVEPPEEE